MYLLPPVVLLSLSVTLGLLLGLRYLRGERSKPVLVAAHLLLGIAGLQVMVLLLRGAPDGSRLPAGPGGSAAAILLIAAIVTGFLTPMFSRRKPRKVRSTALAFHAGFAATGFAAFLVWALGA